MKKFSIIIVSLLIIFVFVGCGSSCSDPIQLMGAGDKIHDSYTFANVGTVIKNDGKNTYTISGSVEKLEDENVKKEFNIAEDVSHVVAIKLCAENDKVVKDEVEIYINGARNYDAEHLNGSHFTYIILEAKQNQTVSISVKWNSKSESKTYILYFSKDLILK